MMSKYAAFETADFVLDETFRDWVLAPTPEANAFWRQFLQTYPHQRQYVEEARLLLALRVDWQEVTPGQSLASFHRLEARLPREPVRPWWKRPAIWYPVAAVLTLLLVSAGAWWAMFGQAGGTRYRTGFGQTRTITLPDQSVVALNANSVLTVPAEWDRESNREVVLEGEAFFTVRKRGREGHPVKFTVRSRELAIEVLGTAFNVNNRRHRTEVVLASGKVRLRHAAPAKQQLVEMRPGERVVFSPARQFSKQTVNVRRYDSWRRRELIFDNTPVSEIAQVITDTYGLTVVIREQEIAQARFTGTVPSDDLSALRTALARALDLEIELEEDKQMIISKSGD